MTGFITAAWEAVAAMSELLARSQVPDDEEARRLLEMMRRAVAAMRAAMATVESVRPKE